MASSEPESSKPEDKDESEGSKPERSARERATVNRFKFEAPKSPSKLQISKGKGIPLKEIPNVCAILSRWSSDSVAVVALHKVLYGRDGKQASRKKAIREFSGTSDECTPKVVEGRISKVKSISVLKEMTQILNCVPEGKDRGALVDALVKFLQKPTDTGRDLPPSKGEARQKAAEKRKKKQEARQRKQAKKDRKSKKYEKGRKDGPKKATSAFLFYSIERRPEITKKHPELSFAEVAQKVAREWGRMDDNDKKEYNEKALKDKERYERELKEFKANTKSKKKNDDPKEKKKKKEEGKKKTAKKTKEGKSDSESESTSEESGSGSESEEESDAESSTSSSSQSSNSSSQSSGKKKPKKGKKKKIHIKKHDNADKVRSSNKVVKKVDKKDKKSVKKPAKKEEKAGKAGKKAVDEVEEKKKENAQQQGSPKKSKETSPSKTPEEKKVEEEAGKPV